MVSLEEVCRVLSQIAPLRLAESWDNVGLLVGDRRRSVAKVITCLTITPSVVDEAIQRGADVIVAHHPLPFKPLKRITSDSTTGQMLLKLIAAEVAIYSAHTAFDSAQSGINQMWSESLELSKIEPLIAAMDETASESQPGIPADALPGIEGAGRCGLLPTEIDLQSLAQTTASLVDAGAPRIVGDPTQTARKIAFACGSGGSFLAAAKRRGCDALVTGEATFHTCLEAESWGIGMVLLGHYWSERFAMERLAERLTVEIKSTEPIEVWASQTERDPVVSVPPKH